MAATVASIIGLASGILGLISQVNALVDRNTLLGHNIARTRHHVEYTISLLDQRYRDLGGGGSCDTIRNSPPGIAEAVA